MDFYLVKEMQIFLKIFVSSWENMNWVEILHTCFNQWTLQE
jgi:hypothetical protein